MNRLLVLCLFGLTGVARAAAAPATSTPQIFEPGTISGINSEDCLSFTPDGDTAFYDMANSTNSIIVESHKVKGRWSSPKIASFSGTWMDHDPALSPDGSFIVFASNRPATGDTFVEHSGGLWRVDRKGQGWGEPVRLPDVVNTGPRIYAPSIAKDGSVYFIRPGSDNVLHIFRSEFRDGSYQEPVQQALGDPAGHQKDPAIAPDESFVVFDAADPANKNVDRFFIAFREGDHWGTAADLGDGVNASNNPWGPHLGPDGRTLYYTSDRSVPVTFPRSKRQAQEDFVRMQGWDDGENNIWYVSLDQWIDAHKAGKG